MIADVIALVLMLAGALLTLVASIGVTRFRDVLTRMHAASKPQTVGLILIVVGMAIAIGSWAAASIALLVLLAQMATAPASSSLLARVAFRRGFVRGGHYAIDELSPRLFRVTTPTDGGRRSDELATDSNEDDRLAGDELDDQQEAEPVPPEAEQPSDAPGAPRHRDAGTDTGADPRA